MKAALLLLVCTSVALAAFVPVEPIRPHFSETFEGEGYAHITNANGSHWGIGHWAIDQPNGRGIERWEFSEHERHHNVRLLQRYDLGFDYSLSYHEHHEVCHKHAVKPPMPAMWSWLHEARYHGKHVIDGITYDEWTYHAGGVTLGVAVSETHADRPVYYYRGTSTHKFEVHFISYEHRQPNASWFAVPSACANATDEEMTGTVEEKPINAADPARPIIPETFEAVGSSHHRSHNDSTWGFGRWAIDQPNGHGIENWEYDEHAHHRFHVHLLERYDLSKAFTITRDHEHKLHCRSHEVKPPMPQHWLWIKDAHYIGKHHIGEHVYDQWSWKNAGISLTVSVHEEHPNRPYWFERRSHSEHFEIHFARFEDKAPNATWFVVPDICKNASDITSVSVPEKLSPLVTVGNMVGDVCRTAVSAAVVIAKNDCPYTYGGNGPCSNGYDNDGMMATAFSRAGVYIPRLVTQQQENGNGCSGGARAGDLLFVNNPATHVAMVIDHDLIAECPLDGTNCRLASMGDISRFDGGCRRYC